MKSRNPLKLGQIEDGVALREEDNIFTEDNEFVKPLKVADGVDDRDAVNKWQLDSKINEGKLFARYKSNQDPVVGEIEFDEIMFSNTDSIFPDLTGVGFELNGYYEIVVVVLEDSTGGTKSTTRIMLNNNKIAAGYQDAYANAAYGYTVSTGVIYIEAGSRINIYRTSSQTHPYESTTISIKKIK